MLKKRINGYYFKSLIFFISLFMQKIIKKYLKKITNLSSSNRSLLLLQLAKDYFIDFNLLNFIENKPSFDYIRQLISGKSPIILSDVLDSRFEKNNEISKILSSIARTEKFIEQERGTKDLYVGFPFIKGKLKNGTLVRCPLLFFPVSLQNNGKKWFLEQRNEGIILNKSFLLAYAFFNKIAISDDFLDTSFEDFPSESITFLTKLYEFLKDSPLEINFNSEIFQENLIDFPPISKLELEKNERNGELKLFPQAVLGIFPQSGSFFVNDYEYLLQNNPEFSFDRFAHLKSLSQASEEDTFLPFPYDASQEIAILQIKKGKSLVVQGPPGTGKSQMIANLIADFSARGKKVLLVCQKRVALDTVYKRLLQIGMNNFVALVHDFRNDRRLLFDKIASQIDSIKQYEQQNKSLDAIFLERNFAQTSRKIDKITEELELFKQTLFDQSIAGESPKELYLTIRKDFPSIVIPDFKKFRLDQIDEFLDRLKHWLQYQHKFQETDVLFWQKRRSFSHFKRQNLQEVLDCIRQIVHYKSQYLKDYSIPNLLQISCDSLENCLNLLTNKHILYLFQSLISGKKYVKKNNDLQKLKEKINSLHQNNWIENSLPSNQLAPQLRLLKKIQNYNPLFFTFWKLFSKEKSNLEAILKSNSLLLEKSQIDILIQKIENRILLEKYSQDVKKWNLTINASMSFEEISIAIKNYQNAILAWQFLEESGVIINLPFEIEQYWHLLQATQELHKLYPIWNTYLSSEQIVLLTQEPSKQEKHCLDLEEYFDFFCESDRIYDNFDTIERAIAEQLPHHKENAIPIFLNTLRLRWLEYLEVLSPILRCTSTLKMGQLEEELQNAIEKKSLLSQEILLLKLREQTYQNRVFNRLNNNISYRELHHQSNKKRKLWSIRQLLENYSDEIFRLLPCWMASPESVSAIFPMQEKMFDLVIFDEASQCFAEYGIPAIYRAKQVAIVGDSRQLKPNDLYQIRYEEENEDEPLVEIDALLDLAKHFLEQVSLTNHYRSQSLDLIEFSNQYFYKKSLKLLPHYELAKKQQVGIDYIKIDGIWENNSNQAEAEKIVLILEELLSQYPDKSYGVVTFNKKQANLIQNMLYLGKYEQVTVKNIENIQGDEFDIVLFSIAYAPNKTGKISVNFGSLSQNGGENRLNVAVSRAKEKIILVSSIYPEQLAVENTENEGPKLLKKYLEFAWKVSRKEYIPQAFEAKKYHSPHYLKNKLKIKYPQYKEELPFADLTLKNTDGLYESLVLTDDDIYFEAISVKESHAYLPLALKQKAWKFRRVWSRNELFGK